MSAKQKEQQEDIRKPQISAEKYFAQLQTPPDKHQRKQRHCGQAE